MEPLVGGPASALEHHAIPLIIRNREFSILMVLMDNTQRRQGDKVGSSRVLVESKTDMYHLVHCILLGEFIQLKIKQDSEVTDDDRK